LTITKKCIAFVGGESVFGVASDAAWHIPPTSVCEQ